MKGWVFFAIVIVAMATTDACQVHPNTFGSANYETSKLNPSIEDLGVRTIHTQSNKHLKNLAATAAGIPELSKLVAFAKAAGTVGPLVDPSSTLTAFSPNNAAFEEIEDIPGRIPKDKKKLMEINNRHFLPNAVYSTDLKEGEQKVTNIGGSKLTITKTGGEIIVTSELGYSGKVIKGDIQSSNGVIHIIDGTL